MFDNRGHAILYIFELYSQSVVEISELFVQDKGESHLSGQQQGGHEVRDAGHEGRQDSRLTASRKWSKPTSAQSPARAPSWTSTVHL